MRALAVLVLVMVCLSVAAAEPIDAAEGNLSNPGVMALRAIALLPFGAEALQGAALKFPLSDPLPVMRPSSLRDVGEALKRNASADLIFAGGVSGLQPGISSELWSDIGPVNVGLAYTSASSAKVGLYLDAAVYELLTLGRQPLGLSFAATGREDYSAMLTWTHAW